jgi:hypothetical protein
MPAKKTLSDFVKAAIERHGNSYDYTKSEYINNSTKLIITCPAHGDFSQTPNSHLAGKGCMDCSGKKPISIDQFISRSEKIHGDKYDYSKVVITSTRTKVLISCPHHGQFNQRPDAHMDGHGCQKCAKIQRPLSTISNTSKFIDKSLATHGDRYLYSDVNYRNSKTPVSVICKTHGTFYVKPSFHLMGQGCPTCSPGGYNPTKPGFVYALKSHCGTMMKIGITNNPDKRYSSLSSSTPFQFSIEACAAVPGQSAQAIEGAIHKMLKKSGLSGFNGSSEWFSFEQWPIDLLNSALIR